MKKSTILLASFLLVLAVAGVFLIKENRSQPRSTVKIAAVLPLTGEVASYGTDTRDGINLAIQKANESQSEIKFEVDYYDTAGDSKMAVTAVRKALTKQPVAIIGENTSSATAAMIPIADEKRTVLLSPSASAPNLTGQSSYFFRIFPSDTAEGEFIAEAVANRHPAGKVAIIHVNNDYGVGLSRVFTEAAGKLNMTILSTTGYGREITDFKNILTKIAAEGPDAIYIPSYYQDGGAIVRQARELKITASLYGCTTHEDPKFIEEAGTAAEGFLYPMATGYDPESNSSHVKEFALAYQQKYNKNPGLVSALGYDCANIIIRGVKESDPSPMIPPDYLFSLEDFEGATGKMSFSRKGDVLKQIQLKTVRGGKFTAY